MRTLFFLGGLALAGTPAFAISKVGNSKIEDQTLGFETVFPLGLYESRGLPDAGLELQTPPKFVTGSAGGQPGFRNLRIQLRSFASEPAFRDLAGSDPAGVRHAFLDMNTVWWEARTPDPCVLVFLSQQNNAQWLVATWGRGKGLFIWGEKDDDIQRGMREMLAGLRLEAGACAW